MYLKMQNKRQKRKGIAMMKKVTACILSVLFLLSAFTAIDITSTTAKNVSITWGEQNPLLENIDKELYRKESLKNQKVCKAIDIMFSNKASWLHADSYGHYTQPEFVYQSLDNVANPYNGVDFAAVFWLGDFNHPFANRTNPAPYGYHGCYTNTTIADVSVPDEAFIWDYKVYDHVTAYGNSKNYFTFMWTCANGGTYWSPKSWTSSYPYSLAGGYYDVLGIISPVRSSVMPNWTPVNLNALYGYRVNSSHVIGMPYAWTGGSSMNLDGYSNPQGDYTFIGWENTSPSMGEMPPEGYTSEYLEYSFFVYYFYSYATGQITGFHESINDSLDYASRMAFGRDDTGKVYTFKTSILNVGQWKNDREDYWFYCRLRVFGNGDMILPD